MILLHRLKASLRGEGMATTFTKIWIWLADHLFDIRYGVDTCKNAALDALTIESQNKEHGCPYQPTRVAPLRKLFREIGPILPPNSVLIDLGCGKGRVLLVASQFEFKEVRGVEFARELCETARKNCAAFSRARNVRAEFRIIEADVTLYEIQPDETVFFMFNPFDEAVLSKVLANIETSLQARPRKILILYYNPKGAGVIEQRRNFARKQECSFWGYRFVVYENRD